jgi:hypothetical protein
MGNHSEKDEEREKNLPNALVNISEEDWKKKLTDEEVNFIH